MLPTTPTTPGSGTSKSVRPVLSQRVSGSHLSWGWGGVILRHYVGFAQSPPGNLHSIGTSLGVRLFGDVISGGRCILILQDVNMLMSAPGDNAGYF